MTQLQLLIPALLINQFGQLKELVKILPFDHTQVYILADAEIVGQEVVITIQHLFMLIIQVIYGLNGHQSQ